MKAKILIALLPFCMVNGLNSQVLVKSDGQPATDFSKSMTNNGVWVSSSSKVNDPIEGSTYLFENFFNKSKVFYENDVYNINMLNYNLKNEKFEAKLSQDSIFILNTRFVKQIMINQKVLVPYYNGEQRKLTFYEKLGEIDGKVLLKEDYLTVISGNIDPMTKQKRTPDRYKINERYFLGDKDGNITEPIKLKKKQIIKLFNPDFKGEIQNYVDDNKLKLNDDDDVMKLIVYYNSLLQNS